MTYRTAIITGATGGIGREIALLLAQQGYSIIATGRSLSKLKKLKDEIDSSGGICNTYGLDIADTQAIKKFAHAIGKQKKKFEWLIHSAGFISKKENASKFQESEIQKTFATNLFGPMRLSEAILPMLKNGGIVALSSTAGIWGNEKFPLYSSSKGALNTFMASLSKSPAVKDLTIFTICPGPTDTPMRRKIADGNDKESLGQSPKAVAGVVLEMISSKDAYKSGTVAIIRNGELKILA